MSAHAQTTPTRRIGRWLARRWNLELLLWFVSLSTFALVWQFAKAWNIPYLNVLPSITEVRFFSTRLSCSQLASTSSLDSATTSPKTCGCRERNLWSMPRTTSALRPKKTAASSGSSASSPR